MIAKLILLVALAAYPAGPARDGETVVEIQVVGNRRVVSEQVVDSLRTKVGAPLDAALIQEDIRDLYARFGARVTMVQEVVPGGVRLLLEVAEEQLVSRVEMRGVPEARAQELLADASLLGVRAVLESQVRERARELIATLKDEGRYFADVAVAIEERDGATVAVLEVHEGPRVAVDDIEFVGLASLDAAVLKRVMTTGETRFIVFKSYLKQDALERDVIELERYLHSEGFRDARVSVEELRFDAEQDGVTVFLRVQEGARTTVASVRFAGNRAVTDEELLPHVELALGGPIREAVVEKDRRRLLDAYGARGHVRARVEPRISFRLDETAVDVTYEIEEGPSKTVRDVIVRGNAGTRDEVVRREVTLHPGDPASTEELRRSAQRLRATGYFVDDGGRPLVEVHFRETKDPLLEDVLVNVEESRSGKVRFMAGANTDQGFFAGVNLEKNNFDVGDAPSSWNPVTVFQEFWRDEAFHGGGQYLRISALPGNKVSDFRLTFIEPYLGGPDEFPWSLNLELYATTERLFDEFRQNRYGVTTGFAKKLDDQWTAGVTGRMDLVDIDDVDGDAPDDVEDVEGLNFVPGVGGFVRFQDYDDPWDPAEGHEFGAKYELLGADAAGQRVVVNGTWLVPVAEDQRGRRSILAMRGALGAAHGFGGDLPFFERFYGGGASGDFPLRGFDYRGIGPESEDVHLGGHLAYAAGAEYRFPIWSSYDPLLDEELETVRGVFFVDAGSVEDTVGSLLGTPRLAVGGGVRVLLPFLGPTPVAVDFGVPLLSGDEDETELFSVRVSTRF